MRSLGLILFFLALVAAQSLTFKSDLLGISAERVREIRYAREREAFQNRVRTNNAGSRWVWPPLRAASVSWTWMEMLSEATYPESYQGNYSWLFSRLNFLIEQVPREEERFLSGLAPVYFVMGSDHIGATILMNEILNRSLDNYLVTFWSAMFAMDVLQHRELAADLFERAARHPQAPDHFVFLAHRLKTGKERLSQDEKVELLKRGD